MPFRYWKFWHVNLLITCKKLELFKSSVSPLQFFLLTLYFSPPKTDFLKCFELQGKETEKPPKTFDCVVLDGAAIVHFFSPSKSDKTFQDYSLKRYIPYLEGLLKYCDQIDLVFDRYLAKSLKDAVRDKCGSGTRFKVQANGKLPVRWSDFLFVSENKRELFHFLAKEINEHSFKGNK